MLLYGASGHCRVVKDCVEATGEKIKGIFDDNEQISMEGFKGKYAPDIHPKEKLLISIGDNLTRKTISANIKHTFGNTVHPRAIVSKYSTYKEGTVFFPGSVVNAGASIGRHCIVNTSAIIEHDCVVEDFCHISPNATLGGGVIVGEGVLVGTGAVVLPGIKIGKWSIIAAGAVVTEDVAEFTMVAGIPAKFIKKTGLEV
jgi:sugar O-acyltransferase (sialic acid O-acetyltransferase NeuD family)